MVGFQLPALVCSVATKLPPKSSSTGMCYPAPNRVSEGRMIVAVAGVDAAVVVHCLHIHVQYMSCTR